MIEVYAVYNWPILDSKKQTDWKWKNGKIVHVNSNQKKSVVAILTLENFRL